MKQLLIAIALLSLTTVVSAQSNKTEKRQNTSTSSATKKNIGQKVEKSPFAFDSLVIDYGVITKGSSGETVFRFKNTGNTPIVLTKVEADCGCTTPEFTNQPVLPGKTGEIKVNYDTSKMGYFNKNIFVTSNINPDKPVTLVIKGEVVN
ncbi:MAG: DUF1573 domain-containing protein [Bacteroidetes bacterium]|nr:DUF1573 domain-containing protein [Bacteroidota bacterium]